MPASLDPHGRLDLEAYFARIGFPGPGAPDVGTLEALCLRHAGAIPFENLDPLAGRAVDLELGALEAKLVKGGRGGYCFEHNLLFGAVLERLGLGVELREARVLRGVAEGQVLPRTHGVLEVEAGGRGWLVDVGFGAEGLLGPVPLDGTPVHRHGETWRLREDGRLQADLGQGWVDLYELQPARVFAADWRMANHFTATHPDSRFRKTLTVQVAVPGARRALRGLTLALPGVPDRAVDPGDLPEIIRSVFGLDPGPGLLDVCIKRLKDNG